MNTEIFTDAECKEHVHSIKLGALIKDWFGGPDLLPERPRVSEAAKRKVKGLGPVLDFGCGNGSYLEYLAAYPFPRLIGVDGTHSMTDADGLFGPEYVQWDLAHPLWLGVKGNVMSIEVAEHLHAQHHDTYLDTLSRHCTGKLVLTWAVRGQGGLRHVSERNQTEVVPYVERWGFKFLAEESNRWRAEAGQDLSWFGKSIYLFQRPF